MMDWISQLPESVVHHILSFINTREELVRMSVLSKTWFNLTASFPFLDFNMDDFRYSRGSFFKYVEYTTSRFCHQNVTAHRLRFITSVEEPAELDIVNRCLELLLKKGVKVLVIGIANMLQTCFPSVRYRLPNILLSVSALTYLTIISCELPSSLMLDVVKFKSLIHLELIDVHIDDEVIKYLATSCPLLQVFHVNGCHGFQRFCVYGHQNLQEVVIYFISRLERIDIEAPSLSNLLIEDSDVDEIRVPQMNLASCKKLTTMSYNMYSLTNSNRFPDLLSNFPFIENLCLSTKHKGNKLKLSSHSLRTLVLHTDCDLEEIEFSTPNLALFMYSCSPRLPKPLGDKRWPLEWNSTNFKACMHCYPERCLDALWFQKLRLFLDKKNGFKVFNLYIDAIYCQIFIELEKLKAIQLPPYELEHVELRVGIHESYVAFVDAVLLCCRPQSLTLTSPFPFTDFGKQSDIVKFAYEKLLQQEDQDRAKIQIMSRSSSRAQKHSMDLKSLSMALPRERKTISFIKRKKFLKKKRTVKRMQI